MMTQPISDLVVRVGSPFEYDLRPQGQVAFGLDVGGANLEVTDNYFASVVQFLKSWEDVEFAGNDIVTRPSPRSLVMSEVPSPDVLSGYTWEGNSYQTTAAAPFVYAGSKTWDQWRAASGLDADSELLTVSPTNRIHVRPNRYQPGRGHAVVYNWERLESVSVDLSAVVAEGAQFQIISVLDLEGPPVVEGIYAGGEVELPMTDQLTPTPRGHVPTAPLRVEREFGTFLIVSEAPHVPATGTEFFVSVEGSPAGDGSAENPWDLATAFAHPAAVRPGDTIWVRGGVYNGHLTSQLAGTEAQPISVRAFPGEEVKWDLFLETESSTKLLRIDGQHTWFEGFEIFSSDPASRTTATPGSWPEDVHRGDLVVSGDHIQLINLVVRDLDAGIGYWSAASGGEVHGTLIYNNGWSGPDRNHGHGIYSQNEDALRTFSDNIIFNQFRNGIIVYGSSAASLKNHLLEGNVTFNNGRADGEGASGAFEILIGGGSVAENMTLRENHTYVGAHTFQDPDVGDRLTYEARQSNGAPLPQWLSFYGSEGYLVGTPSLADVGTVEVEITARDRAGASVSDLFTITVTEGADVTAPLVTAFDVPDDAIDVAIDVDLRATFSEPVAPGTGNILIRRASDGVAVQTIDARSSDVVFDGADLRVRLRDDLAPSTDYFVQIYSGAVRDLAGNAFAGISDAVSWSFTTAPPPQVASISINGGDTQRSSVTRVDVTFSAEVEIDFAGGEPFRFRNRTTGESVQATRQLFAEQAATVVRFEFQPGASVGPAGTLHNGEYELVISAAHVRAYGMTLDGDRDGSAGGDLVFRDQFYRKYGDYNGNGLVDINDYFGFRESYGKSSGDTGYLAEFDHDGDDQVGIADYLVFRSSFGS